MSEDGLNAFRVRAARPDVTETTENALYIVAIDNILSCGCILLLGVFFRICALFVRFFATGNLSVTQNKKVLQSQGLQDFFMARREGFELRSQTLYPAEPTALSALLTQKESLKSLLRQCFCTFIISQKIRKYKQCEGKPAAHI